jgi:DNA-directed RNA polymerase sigma subunit (sigma70/sigma32)
MDCLDIQTACGIVWHMRIRLTNHTVRTKREHHGEMLMIPHAPLRTMQECAGILGITLNQAHYIERVALEKLRPALVAYGYHKEFRQGH